MIIVQGRWVSLAGERGLRHHKTMGNSEGSNPVQRGDGRWQVTSATDEDGRSRRYAGGGTQRRRGRNLAAGRLRANLPARDRKYLGVVE
jgi:hypothetical protein